MTKNPAAQRAAELYASQLFAARVRYCEEHGLTWFVLSARFGLVVPFQKLPHYDQTIEQKTPMERAGWHLGVARQLLELLDDSDNPRKVSIEIHAGAAYCSPLSEVLRATGFTVETPVAGIAIGQQLQFYSLNRLHQSADGRLGLGVPVVPEFPAEV
ncbi:MAG: hypothetical protein JNM43_07590 [Planctomycetaceae bacterium]|nr:hypothetical protein [Planctomycetaceae bacterium]